MPWGKVGGGSGIVVVTPPPPPPPSGWPIDPLFDPPFDPNEAGVQNFEVNQGALDGNGDWQLQTISIGNINKARIVFPMPGSFKADGTTNATHRKGGVFIEGGKDVMCVVRETPTTFRRGGFSIEIPAVSAYPPDARARIPFTWRQSGNSVDGGIKDVFGCLLFGADIAEGFVANDDKAIFRFDRCRTDGLRYRCGADRAGNNKNTADGYVATSAYANFPNTHPDGYQCWRYGFKELWFHQSTLKTCMGCFTMPTLTYSVDGNPIKQGDIYLANMNIGNNVITLPEPDGNTQLSNPTGNIQGARWYFHFGTNTTRSTARHLYVQNGTVYVEPVSYTNQAGTTTNRDILSMVNPSGAVAASPGWFEWNGTFKGVVWTGTTQSSTADRFAQSWDGVPGGATDAGTSARVLWQAPAANYAPLSMWGGDGNSWTA